MELIATMTATVNTESMLEPDLDEPVDESDEIYNPYTPSYFEETLATGRESHVQWLLVSRLMRNIVWRFNAVIFGGAVRDTILHSHAAHTFYFLCAQKGTCLNIKDYDNPDIHTELSDRFLIPKDIDFFMNYSKLHRFKKYLYKKGFYFNEQKHMDLSYVNKNLHSGEYTLMKAEIIYFDKLNKKSYPILLDIILSNQEKIVIPQMDPDFNVNKLIMTDKGIISTSIEWTFNQIKECIHKKEAICYSITSHARYEKMKAKGWKVTMNYSTFVFKLRTNEEEESCVICLDTLKVGELEVLPKDCKCKYSYCKSCLPYTLKSTQCLMCKKDMCSHKKECDIKMYEKYKILNN